MKWTRSICILSVFLGITRARADLVNDVWFEATGQNAASQVLIQGVEGGNLSLTCDTFAGPATCQWDIAMQMHSAQQFGAMGTNLLGNADKHVISNVIHGNFPDDGYSSQTPNSSGLLAKFKQVNIPIIAGPDHPVFDPTDGAAGEYLLFSFTLTTTKSQGDQTIDYLDAAVNELLWASLVENGNGQTPPTFVQFGAGAPVNGLQQTMTPNVIAIHSVPEPASILLIAFAGTMCFRRCGRPIVHTR